MKYNLFVDIVINSFRQLNKNEKTDYDYSDYKNSENFEIYRNLKGFKITISIHTENENYMSFLIHKNKKLFVSKRLDFGTEIYKNNFKRNFYDGIKYLNNFFEAFTIFCRG